eukprot:2205112-Pyramimonas_sp.AAC.1
MQHMLVGQLKIRGFLITRPLFASARSIAAAKSTDPSSNSLWQARRLPYRPDWRYNRARKLEVRRAPGR